MHRYVFSILYNGITYQGYQRQLNGRSIENFTEMAFIKAGYISSFSQSDYIACSRTDAGVSAWQNIFALNMGTMPNLLYLNDYLPQDIIIWAFSEVDLEFNPRYSTSKCYHYYLPKSLTCYNLDRLYSFVGVHDFSSFIKRDGAGAHDAVNTILSIDLSDSGEFVVIKITGTRFGREQIRRMIGFFLMSKFRDTPLREIFGSSEKYDIRAAPPEYLILASIQYQNEINWIVPNNIEFLFTSLGDKPSISCILQSFLHLLTQPH